MQSTRSWRRALLKWPWLSLQFCRLDALRFRARRERAGGILDHFRTLFPERSDLNRIAERAVVRSSQFGVFDHLLGNRRYQAIFDLIEWPSLGSLLKESRERPILLCMWHSGPIYTVVWGCHLLGLPTYAMVGGFRPEMQIGHPVELVSLSSAESESGRAPILKEALRRLEEGKIVLLSADHAPHGRPLSFLGSLVFGSAALPFLAKRSGAAVFPITARVLPSGRRRIELGPDLSASDDVLRAVADYHEQWLRQYPEELRFDRLKYMANYIRKNGRLSP